MKQVIVYGLRFLLQSVICLGFVSCGGDDGGNAGSSVTPPDNGGGGTVVINESNIKNYVSCSLSNSFTFSNGSCKWYITATFSSTLTSVISANRIRYGIAYGTVASLGEDFSERSLYTESTVAIMKKMGVDALGEKYESGNAGNSFSISKSSTQSGQKVSSEEIDLLKAIKPYAVVAAFVEVDGKRYVIYRNGQTINIR